MFAFEAATEPLTHGSDLAAARRLFPAAPGLFRHPSTGINLHPCRMPRLPADACAGADAWERLQTALADFRRTR